ncbi:hypothetical protein [Pseudonocardia sediminis]|uniref:hypothetical protein n=1 Tax=Pseudonocardia sediminis TaxID=1397368 RepID=UPI00102A72F0|nr:hypothetical protein [Pseudonocardia sediminis]
MEFVDDTGATHLAHDMAGAWGLVYGGCLLKRAVPELPFKAAAPSRAEFPREVSTRRGEPAPKPAAEAAETAVEPPADPTPPETPARPRRTIRKG